jgi:hypothetical protein
METKLTSAVEVLHFIGCLFLRATSSAQASQPAIVFTVKFSVTPWILVLAANRV